MINKKVGNKKRVVKKQYKKTVVRKKKRRKLRKSVVVIGLSLLFLLIAIPSIKIYKHVTRFDSYKSVNENASSSINGNCIVFYPNSSYSKEIAKDFCEPYKDAEEIKSIDYKLEEKGDYYLISYSKEHSYITDKSFNPLDTANLTITDNGKLIISDYLRYTMKSKEIDEAYTSKFLEDTYYENLDLSNCEYKVNGENLSISFPQYNEVIDVPLKYLQKELNMNLGENDEMYIRLHYVSPNRKKIAITFDDGPFIKVTSRMLNTLYKYDSVGTFFTLGWRLGENEINLVKDAISKGNEYGSHTESHPNLTKISDSEIYYEVMMPYNVLKDSFGYEMKDFRPPYGAYNDNVLAQVPLKAVLWNVDSEDWKRKDMEEEAAASDTVSYVLETMKDNGIILMHDIYPNSAAALEKLVPILIDQGYQLVTVNELKETLGRTEDNPFH